MRRAVGETGMPLHDNWLGPSALGRSASIRAGIVWASFGASFKDYVLSAFPSISKNPTRLGGLTFWGIVLGGGPIVLHAFHIPVELVVRFL